MTSRIRRGNTVEAGVLPAVQPDPQSTPLPLGKGNVRIREARLGDASALAVLMCQLGYETQRTEMETRLKSILCNPAYRTFVAIMDGDVCGMIGTLTYTSYEHNEPSGRILAMVTLEAARRRGIGRALMEAAEENFAKKGIGRVALDTQLAREDAHKFYESLGYERNGWRFVKQLAVRDL
jgi:GNAT superfamily N-acetyltransferase